MNPTFINGHDRSGRCSPGPFSVFWLPLFGGRIEEWGRLSWAWTGRLGREVRHPVIDVAPPFVHPSPFIPTPYRVTP